MKEKLKYFRTANVVTNTVFNFKYTQFKYSIAQKLWSVI